MTPEDTPREPDSGKPNGRTRRQFLKDMAVTSAGLAAASLPAEVVANAGAVAAAAAVGGVALAAGNKPKPVTLRVNGKDHKLAIEPRVTLLDALRETMHMTGTKKGCDHGQCGACTVLVDGRRVNSCLTLACMHEKASITTIEGLATGEELHPMQQAFVARDAFQCGYCTPGQICSAVGLLLEGRPDSDDAIREGMSGNICRCGAYPNILAAIKDVRDGGQHVAPRA